MAAKEYHFQISGILLQIPDLLNSLFMFQPNANLKFARTYLVLLAAISQTFSVFAQSPKRKQFIETNGPVQTMKQDGNILYMGGNFTGAGYKPKFRNRM